MVTLFALAAIFAFGAAALYLRGRQYPPAALGLALALLALGHALEGVPPTPEPEPPPVGGDFGGYRPHFQGFGANTRAGRGGPVCKVITLTIDGSNTFGAAGDLADCTAPRPGCVDTWETCARTVVFTVSGTSRGNGQISITSPYLTVAGQTAPSPGFTLDNARFLVDTHDVYVGHIRVRRPPKSLNGCSTGDAGDGGDNSHVRFVIWDHVSCSWATNVNNYLQAGPGSGNVLLTDSLIYEGLWDPPWGGIGAGVGGDATVVRNVFAHHQVRQPVWGSPARLILANNVSYNGGDSTQGDSLLPAYFGDLDGDGSAPSASESMILWNVLVKGPDSGNVRAFLGLSKKSGSLDAESRIFLEGNTGPGVTGSSGDGQWVATVCGNYGANYTSAATCGPGSNLRTNEPFAWWNAFNMGTLTANIQAAVLANAGARPKDRDAADARVIADVTEGDGTHFLDWSIIESRYGGMPVLAANTRDVPIPANPTAPGNCGKVTDGTPRTVLECFLESDAAYGARRLEAAPGAN